MFRRIWPMGTGRARRALRRARPILSRPRRLGQWLSAYILRRPALRPLLLAALVGATASLPVSAEGLTAPRLSFGAVPPATVHASVALRMPVTLANPGLPDLAPAPVVTALDDPGLPPELAHSGLPHREVTLAQRQEQARRRTAERMAKTRREVPIRVSGNVMGGYPTAGQAKAMQVPESEFQCLAETLYFEARGESARGQAAVAEVILNRVDSGRFPNTICGVVKQGRTGGCQFSYNCGDRSREITDRSAFARVQTVARRAIEGAPRELTDGATYFHTPAVRPDWSRRFVKTVQIDNHIFYRPGLRVAAR